MQAVILAGGKSTRTYPLTLTKPKPLLKVANKTLIEHNLENLRDLVDEVIVVVGYKKQMVIDFLKNFKDANLRFVEQAEQLGSGHAILITKKHVKNEFIVLNGDDIFSKEDFKKIIGIKYAILTTKSVNPENFGVIIEKNNLLMDIIEKPSNFVSNIINAGLYKFDKKLFPILKKIKISERGEYEITEGIKALAKIHNVYCVPCLQWLPIGYPWDLLKADAFLRKNKSVFGKNSIVYGSVENSSIGDNCLIKGKIKNSIIMNNSVIDSDSIIEDSVIGENVYFKGIAKSERDSKSIVNNKPVVVERLGAIIGDNVKAENVEINPGCKIWPNKNIKGKIVTDIK